jgi:hypothetical protein
MTLKNCIGCRRELAPDAFGLDGKRSKCRECYAAYSRKWRAENRTKYRAYSKGRRLKEGGRWARNVALKAQYGITIEQYDAMLEAQGGLCAVCRRPEVEPDRWSGKVKSLAVDHCHDTGKVRGLLCSGCNTSLGKMKHDTGLLQAAINYLKGSK